MNSQNDSIDKYNRIVFLLPSLRGGGAEFVARTWAEALKVRGIRAEVALLRYSADEPKTTVPVHKLAAQNAGRVGEIRALRAFLTTLGPDDWVVSMMTRANNQVLLLKRPGGPKIAVSERNIPRTEPGQGAVHIAVRNGLLRALYPKADRLIAISHPVASLFHFGARVSQSKIWVVPNPATGKVGEKGDVSIRARDASVLDMVVPARLVDAKRPELALAVADELHRRGMEVSLRYFGEGALRERYDSLVRSYKVEAQGRVENWFEELTPASIVLLPSAVEGFGNVLLEAAAVGVPSVVGSNTFGSADAVIPGVTGVFARGERVEEFADAVVEAAAIDATVPAAWLRTFSVENSVATLLRALDPEPSDTRTRSTLELT